MMRRIVALLKDAAEAVTGKKVAANAIPNSFLNMCINHRLLIVDTDLCLVGCPPECQL